MADMYARCNRVVLPHLQFADDTLFFCYGKDSSLLILNHVLAIFEEVSGLKINRGKCCIVGINCDEDRVIRWADLARCKIGRLPSSYLGLPLGGNPKFAALWDPVIDKVQKRLASWKKGFFSKTGRLTLIKSVSSGVPVYFFSHFRAPCEVCKSLE